MSSLSGKVLLRFAHAFESGGGTERYLDDLDRALLERNALTVVRLHLTREAVRPPPRRLALGRGLLITQGLPIIGGAPAVSSVEEHSLRLRAVQRVRDGVIYHPLVWPWMARRLARRPLPPRQGQAIGAGAAAAEVMRDFSVDLAVLHFFGGSDTDEILAQTRGAGVPAVLINHYSNDRFLHLSIRKHAMAANAVGGVNGLQLPGYLQGRFTNVSDGIDTDFFRREHARPVADRPSGPVILLPARVTPEKGQMDLLRAALVLRRQGVYATLAFAGRVDASDFVDHLRREMAASDFAQGVRFLGPLNVEELRDWYAASTLVAFPTYHHEGLGRVILEAQAMGTPVIAYGTGGVPDAIVHRSTGILVDTGNVAGLVAGLQELLGSAPLRSTLAARGREAAEGHFSLAALAGRHERFYLEAMEARR